MKIKVFNDSKNGVYETGWEAEFPENYTQIYETMQHVMGPVRNVASFQLFFWIIKHMTKENIISMGEEEKQKFVADLVAIGGKPYSLRQVSTAIKELKDVGMLNVVKAPRYKVNVVAAWKDHVRKRVGDINSIAESQNSLTPEPIPVGLELKPYKQIENK